MKPIAVRLAVASVLLSAVVSGCIVTPAPGTQMLP
jgi:hypothetical protein